MHTHSLLQILTQLPGVLPAALKMPQAFVKFIDVFAILNFATVPRVVRLECEVQFDHYDSVFMITLGPLVLTALGVVCLRVQQQRTPSPVARARLAARYFGVFLLGTYLVYPSVSTTPPAVLLDSVTRPHPPGEHDALPDVPLRGI